MALRQPETQRVACARAAEPATHHDFEQQQRAFISAMPPKRRSTTLARARRRLRGVLREDSDDELGVEDLPWEWMRSAARGDVDERIFGAKMGSFNVCIGDCVLVAGEELKGEAYVGLVCGFEEQEEGEKMAEVQWFSTEAEISNKTKRRRNALPVSRLCSGSMTSHTGSRTNYT